MDFEDILEALINPGPEGPEEGAFDQLRAAHTGALESRDNALSESTEALAALQGQFDVLSRDMLELKASKFDELLNQGSPAKADEDITPKSHSDEATKGELETHEFFEKKED